MRKIDCALTRPVAKRIGLGAWHAISSAVGEANSLTKSATGESGPSNASNNASKSISETGMPGPSVVPLAKLTPNAGTQPLT